MPEWMDKCVRSYRQENPNASKQSAWAVCTAQYKKKFGHAPAREDVMHRVLAERQLTNSWSERARALAKAVRTKWQEMSNDPYLYPSAWVVDIYDDPMEVVVNHQDRLYAVPYTFTDQWTVELGEPAEVVAGYIGVEADTVHYVLGEGWIEGDLDDLLDSDFAWLSDEYREADEATRAVMTKRQHRQLPYAVHGAVHDLGWLGAWKLLHFETYLRLDLRGGPDAASCMDVLEQHKPDKVTVADGSASLQEDTRQPVLMEACNGALMIEEAADESGIAFYIRGTVMPPPDTKFGVYSRNRRLYPPQCVKESLAASQAFLREDTATIHISHYAASPQSGRLPIGKVEELWMENGGIKFRGAIADTSDGQDVRKLIESNILTKVSLRTRDWQSHVEDIGDLGHVEVMEKFVLHGIDFTEVPGLDNTSVAKESEEESMELSELSLKDLQEGRPDLIAEIVETARPEPTIEYRMPEDEALRLKLLEASNTGIGSIVMNILVERVKSADELTEAVLAEARQEATAQLYSRHAPAPATNHKGSGAAATPAEVKNANEGASEPELTEEQREIVGLSGGNAQ